MTHPLLTDTDIEAYQRDGVVLIRGLFARHVKTLRAGVDRNMAEPGPYAAENLHDGESGRFFDDYCNWTRIPEFEDVVRTSEAAAVAADLMGSHSVQMFHDHVLVKEPGTSKPTPWHQDGPYYFVEGSQTAGKGQSCRHAGCQSRTSIRMTTPTNLFRTLMPRVWTSANGRWSPVTRSRSIL